MNYEALVIDDDPAIQEAVADILDSLGHKYDQARSQEDARRLIAAKRYSYYLLDLELPVRTDRGFPRIQTGENLLGEIVKRQGEEKAPIIVMTGHGLDCPDLAVRVMKKGAVARVDIDGHDLGSGRLSWLLSPSSLGCK
jgi:DNA-binding NtrC family response regulator